MEAVLGKEIMGRKAETNVEAHTVVAKTVLVPQESCCVGIWEQGLGVALCNLQNISSET